MKNATNQRLADYIASKELSVNSFSKLLGIPQGTLNQQVNGTVRVSVETLALIAVKFPAANMRWFLTGNGEMEYNPLAEKAVAAQISGETISNDTLFDIISKLQDENASLIRMLSK